MGDALYILHSKLCRKSSLARSPSWPPLCTATLTVGREIPSLSASALRGMPSPFTATKHKMLRALTVCLCVPGPTISDSEIPVNSHRIGDALHILHSPSYGDVSMGATLPCTYPVTLRVTDDSTPALIATYRANIKVLRPRRGPARVGMLHLSGGYPHGLELGPQAPSYRFYR